MNLIPAYFAAAASNPEKAGAVPVDRSRRICNALILTIRQFKRRWISWIMMMNAGKKMHAGEDAVGTMTKT